MDNWQKHVFDKCAALVDEDFKYEEKETTISVNSKEAYIIMKALEDQQKFHSPILEIPADAIGEK